MITNKRKSLIIFGIMIVFLIIMVGLIASIQNKSYAESQLYFSAEQYTDSDALIKDDGLPSDKNIRQFAAEVKAAEVGTSFPELANVIPRQYLESTETNAVYAYNI